MEEAAIRRFEQQALDIVGSPGAGGLHALRDLIQQSVDGGGAPDRLRQALSRVHERCVAADDEAAADLAFDGLDILTGWCGRDARIQRTPSGR